MNQLNTTTKQVLTTAVTTRLTTETTTTSSTTTKSPGKNPCQNGGTWDGDECDCLDNYEGDFCERVDDDIELDEVVAIVEVTLRIVGEVFSEALTDDQSIEYHDFSEKFMEQMDNIFNNIRGYKGVKILKIRSGSIIVDHEVILATNSSEAVSHNFLNKIAEEIKTTLKDPTSSGGNNTGFEIDTSSVGVKEAVLTADCASEVPEKLSQYYTLVVIGKKTICASVCNSQRKDAMKCGNGMCGMKSNGPNCYCDVSQDYWYYGDSCNHMIHKKGFIAGLSVTLIVLLLGLLALLINNVRFHKSLNLTQTKRNDQVKEIMESWEEDDWEWKNPGSLIIENRNTDSIDDTISEGQSSSSSTSYTLWRGNMVW